jgi:hypothetical protein
MNAKLFVDKEYKNICMFFYEIHYAFLITNIVTMGNLRLYPTLVN